MKSLTVFAILVMFQCNSFKTQKLSKEDILKIPHIDDLAPFAAYYTNHLNTTVQLYINDLDLEQKNSQFRMYAKLIWIISWKDNRIKDIKTDVYYFNKNQIWIPEVHSYTNEISEEKVKSYYTDTIFVKRFGEIEAVIFEDYEYTCELNEINTVACNIAIAGYFTFTYNYEQGFHCKDNACLKFTDLYLKIGNTSKQWNLQNTKISVERNYNNTGIEFMIYFVRNVDIARKVITQSPIFLVILMLIQFLLPINSKIRFLNNGFGYILCLMMILSLQFEFFNLDIEKERDIGEFYTAALFFFTIAWMWNTVSANLWISCSHDYKPSLGTHYSRIMTSKYMAWIIPNEIVDSESFLMKIIFLLDKIVCITEIVFMIGLLIKTESFIKLWK